MEILLSSQYLTPIILGAVIVLCIGIIIGVLVANISDRQEKKETRDDLLEELRIWRNKEYRTLHVELDSKIYNSDGELTVNQYKRIKVLFAEIKSWLGIPEESKESLLGGTREVRQPDKITPVSDLTMDEEDSSPKRVSILESVSRIFRPKSSDEASTPMSLVGQVDEILQEELAELGMLDRAIRLMELPDIGMVVLVGVDQYESVEDVPDEEVRKIIFGAVKEWERRTNIE